MTTFTIDADNNITVLASSQQIEENESETETFSNRQELAVLAAKWPGARLVEIWNSLPGVEPVERFTSRQVAATRIWKAIQHLQPTSGPRRRQVASKCSGHQNTSFNPSERTLPGPELFTAPNPPVGLPLLSNRTVVLMPVKFVWLNTLNDSARNCRVLASPTRKFLSRLRSHC